MGKRIPGVRRRGRILHVLWTHRDFAIVGGLLLIIALLSLYALYAHEPSCTPELLARAGDPRCAVSGGIPRFFEILYRLVLLLTIDSTALSANLAPHGRMDSVPGPAVLSLLVARFLAVVLIFFGLFRLFGQQTQALTRSLAYVLSSRRAIVVGFGANGRTVARELRGEGYGVLALDVQPTSLAEEFARRHGIKLLQVDGTGERLLQEISSLRLHRIVVCTDKMSVNLQVAGQILNQRHMIKEALRADGAAESLRREMRWLPPLRLDTHVNDTAAVIGLRDYSQLVGKAADANVRFQVFNFNALSARSLLHHMPPHRIALLRNQRRIHAVLVGFGDMGQALFEELVMFTVHGQFDRPKISIVDRDVLRCRRMISNRYPAHGSIVDIAYHQVDLDPDMGICPEKMALIGQQTEITATYICLGDEGLNIKLALELFKIMQRRRVFLSPLFVRLLSTEGLPEFLQHCDDVVDLFQVLHPFGLSDGILENGLLGDDREHMARLLHYDYALADESTGKQPPDGPALRTLQNRRDGMPVPDYRQLGPAGRIALCSALDAIYRGESYFRGDRRPVDVWTNAMEVDRASNRRVIDHLPVKLASMGLHCPPVSLSKSTLPPNLAGLDALLGMIDEIGANLADVQAGENPGQPEPPVSELAIRTLMDLEHRRWIADRMLDGFTQAAAKQKKRRHHTMMVDYAKVPARYKRKDLRQLSFLIQMMRRGREGILTNRQPILPLLTIGVVAVRMAGLQPRIVVEAHAGRITPDILHVAGGQDSAEPGRTVFHLRIPVPSPARVEFVSAVENAAEVAAIAVLGRAIGRRLGRKAWWKAPSEGPVTVEDRQVHDLAAALGRQVSSLDAERRVELLVDPVSGVDCGGTLLPPLRMRQFIIVEPRPEQPCPKLEWDVDLLPAGVFPEDLVTHPEQQWQARERQLAYLLDRCDLVIVLDGGTAPEHPMGVSAGGREAGDPLVRRAVGALWSEAPPAGIAEILPELRGRLRRHGPDGLPRMLWRDMLWASVDDPVRPRDPLPPSA